MRRWVPCLALALAQPAFAQEPPQAVRLEGLGVEDVLALAGRLVEAGHHDEALVLLDQLGADGAGGPQRDFLAGMIALARKDYPRAETLFRTILAGDPSLVRVRLELARALFLEKRDEDADYHFKLAIAASPPPEVVANIARYREAIRARRSWRFNLALGVAPDSNINSATGKERVEILGLPFELNPDARARSGVGLVAGGDASIRLARDSGMPIYLGAFGRMVRYGDNRFNDIYAGVEAGPEFRISGGRLRVAATGFRRWYGGPRLVTSLGGRLAFDKVVGGKWGLEASLSARNNAYARRFDVDGSDLEAAFAVNRALEPSALGYAYGSVQRSIAKDPGYSNWQARIGLGLRKELGWGLRPEVAVEVGRQVNDARLRLFGRTRRDWRVHATASIYKREWNILGFAPSLRVTWSRSYSTIALYDQKRLRAEIGVTRSF